MWWFAQSEHKIRRRRQMHTIALAYTDAQTLKQLRRHAHKWKMPPTRIPLLLSRLSCFLCHKGHTQPATHVWFLSLSLPQCLSQTHTHISPVSIRGGGDQYSERLSRSTGRWSIKPRYCVTLCLRQPSGLKRSTDSHQEIHCVCLCVCVFLSLCVHTSIHPCTHAHTCSHPPNNSYLNG